LGKLSKKIEELLSAATFAEAGEFETARELVHGSRKVLLVLTGQDLDTKSFTYAMNAAQRIGAALEILLIGRRKSDDDMVERLESVLKDKGVEYEIVSASGCMKTKILERTSKRSDVQFVVAESMEVLGTDCQEEDRSLRGTLKRLKCPLVLVSELE